MGGEEDFNHSLAMPQFNTKLGGLVNLGIKKSLFIWCIIFIILSAPIIVLTPENIKAGVIGSIIGSSANDNFGFSVSTAGDFNGDGIDDIIIGAPGNNSNNGAAYIFFGGKVLEGELTPKNANVTILGPQTGAISNSKFGYSVANAGDLNMDGYFDVIIGAPTSQNAYIFLGHKPSSTPLNLTYQNANITLNGSAQNSFGFAVSYAGDINNDTFDDVMVGDPYFNKSADVGQGQVYIFYGHSSPKSSNSYLNANVTLEGFNKNDFFGWNLSYAGDLNNDSVSDIIIGAPFYINGPNPGEDGAAYVYFGGDAFGSIPQPIPTTSANLTFEEGKKRFFGWSVSNAGDINNDNYDDVIVGAPFYDSDRGSSYIYYGGNPMDNNVDITVVGENAGDNFGMAVSTAGDHDNDGINDDFVIGAPNANNNGSIYIFYGSDSLPTPISAANADSILIGENNFDRFGFDIACAGSIIVNHGTDKIIISAPYYDDILAGVDVGKIYITGYKSWAPITLNIIEGWSFQDEVPSQINDTLRLIYQDNFWAPSIVPGYSDNNYATSTQANWWDALTVKFDLSKYDPAEFDAILKFYARNNETNNCYGVNDNRFKVYDGYKNNTDEDAGPPNSPPVNGYSSLTEPLPDDGTQRENWYKFRIPDVWWTKGINWFTIRIWDGGVDAVKLIMVSTETKTLYLHDDVDADTNPAVPDRMNTTPNTAGISQNLTLQADINEYHRWILTPVLATDLHILGDVDVVLWVSNKDLKDTSIDVALLEFMNPGFTKFAEVTYDLGNALDPATLVPIELPAIDYTLAAGNQLVLSVTATGPSPGPAETVTIYFNATNTGNSYIDIPTDTVIDISWIKTYNKTNGVTPTFTVGEFMQIRAEITDPFGSYDISGAKIKVIAPNSSNLVDDLPMTIEQIDSNDPSVWRLYNFTFINPTVSGIYTIEITAIESNGVTSTEVAVYFLEPDIPNEIIISIDPTTVIADGKDTSIIELWVYDVYGNPISGLEGDLVLGFETGSGSFGIINDYGNGYYNVTFTGPTSSEPDAVINISVDNIFNFTTIILIPGPLHHIIATPQPTSIIAGTSLNFDAKGYDEYNNEVALSGTIWTTTVGTLTGTTDTNADLIAQTKVAKGYVNATMGIIVGSADVKIIPEQLDHINITPSSANVTVDQLQDFDAVGYDKYENIVELTNTMWSTNVGIIQEQHNDNAKFKAQSMIGSGYVDARNGTIAKGVQVNVVPDILFRISITPAPVNVTAGGTQDFTALGYDKYNNVVPVTPTWTSNVGTMDGSTLNARSIVGSGYVNATVGLVYASATVNIIPGSLDYLIVSPSSISIEVGKTSGFSAFGYDKYNNIVPVDPVWTSTAGTMAGPLFTAQTRVSQGYINATVTDISGSATVTLIPGPLHHITISPAEIEVVAGMTQDFEAEGNDQYDNIVAINPVWYTDIGTMAVNKLFAQTNIGTGTVTATYIGINGYANVTIVADELSDLYVAPPYIEIIIGRSQEFTAIGYDKYNNFKTVEPTWSTNVGTMVDNVFTAQSLLGTGIVTAAVALNSTEESITGEAEVVVVLGDFSGRPRILGEVPDQEKYEDCPPWVLILTPYESDDQDQGEDLRWEVTGKNTSLYLLSGELSNDDILRFTPLQNVHGSNQITLWLIDSDGYKDYQTLWVNLTPINDRPVIYGAPDLILHFDDPYSFSFEPYIYDVDNPKSDLTLSTYETTDKKYTLTNGFFVTFNYPRSMLGQDIYVTIIVFDGEAVSEDVIKVSVTDDRVPELVKKLPDVTIYEGETVYNVFNLDDYFSDPDNDALFYFFGETYVNITINDDHTVDVASDSEWYGTDTVTFRAVDGDGALAEDTIIVIVLPKNDPPQISGVPDIMVHYDHDFEFELSNHISDIDNGLEDLIISTSEPKYIRFNEKNRLMMIVNFPEFMKGMSIAVTITVSDGIESSSQVITVKVTDNYPPEILDYLPDIEFNEDEKLQNAFDLDDYFFDPDGEMLFYNKSTNTKITVIIQPDQTVDFSASNNWFGQEPITFRAKDGRGAIQEDTIIVTVIPINDAPYIEPIGEQIGKVGQLWVLDLSEYISDVESNITELEISIESDYITISGLNLIFYSDKVDSQEVLIQVSDGEQTNSQRFNITFNAGEEVITLSELVYWSIIIIILVIVISLALVYKKYSGKYCIEEIYLINKDGTLLSHRTSKKQTRVDHDILSGMLTAIQSFVKESFGQPRSGRSSSSRGTQKIDEWELQQLKVQGHDLLIEHGKYSYMAVLYSGRSGWKLIRDVKRVLNNIEARYAYVMENWDGCMNNLAGVDKMLDPLVSTETPIIKNLNFRPKIPKK